MAALRRIKWVAAQLGEKPGASSSLAMLLDLGDLPGPGWKQRDERTWRTGIDAEHDWAHRARAMKSITSWRSFENTRTSRWVWCQVIPFASPSDAQASMDDLPKRMLRNLRAEVEVETSRSVDPPPVSRAQRVWALEQHTYGDRGDGLALVLAAAVRDVVSVIACSCLGTNWAWPNVAMLFDRQSEHIAREPAT